MTAPLGNREAFFGVASGFLEVSNKFATQSNRSFNRNLQAHGGWGGGGGLVPSLLGENLSGQGFRTWFKGVLARSTRPKPLARRPEAVKANVKRTPKPLNPNLKP